MSGGPSIVRRPAFEKSNTELIHGLRSNFAASKDASVSTDNSDGHPSKDGSLSTEDESMAYIHWTSLENNCLHIPSEIFQRTMLSEERSEYDITVKFFLLPKSLFADWRRHLQSAIACVLKELGVDSVDLLIVSFPGISFDADTEERGECGSNTLQVSEEELFDAMLDAWEEVELLKSDGVVRQIGLAEFGRERLQRFLPRTRQRPTVNQINVKDCCVVPKAMMAYAKQENLELLTHSDCTNILPQGTLRELLGSGPTGAGVLAGADTQDKGLKGDVRPEWVVKYTAVVRDRGVIENKGYFASAELSGEAAS
ncbi:MAG: hypothetical protein Q9222_002757 [Ikaeria aurantiellina]